MNTNFTNSSLLRRLKSKYANYSRIWRAGLSREFRICHVGRRAPPRTKSEFGPRTRVYRVLRTGSSIEQHRIDGRSRLRSRFVTRWPKNSPPRHFYPPPTSCRHPVCPWTHPSARSAARRRRSDELDNEPLIPLMGGRRDSPSPERSDDGSEVSAASTALGLAPAIGGAGTWPRARAAHHAARPHAHLGHDLRLRRGGTDGIAARHHRRHHRGPPSPSSTIPRLLRRPAPLGAGARPARPRRRARPRRARNLRAARRRGRRGVPRVAPRGGAVGRHADGPRRAPADALAAGRGGGLRQRLQARHGLVRRRN